jgi:hypothetical protein
MCVVSDRLAELAAVSVARRVRPPADAPTAACTKAVVASCVVFVPGAAVGAAGVPVNVGEASGANEVATNAVVASTLLLAPGAAVGPWGAPVNVGDASGASDVSVGCWWSPRANVVAVPTCPGVLSINGTVLDGVLPTAPATKAVVAIFVLLSPDGGVGAVRMLKSEEPPFRMLVSSSNQRLNVGSLFAIGGGGGIFKTIC